MRRTSWILALVLGGLGLVGCQQELFPDKGSRTPYERYRVLHGQQRQAQDTRGFGSDPALRERLAPLDQP